ncbi:hypothetical protein [Spirosoma validum]|uniref:STAS/SEC14 domain-containing protein n=1 Tax=Spirosoma validum TaxID=2771355 RepID=A0A927B230_9BACT|nr:hypothetical protein [Spirosoma validum]MBD2753988.1 hypothetical protein [Spirosoma validum]
MKTYQNEHVRVLVECNVHLLTQTWVGLPSSENFRDGTLATLALAKRHQIKRWQIDLRQLRLFNPVDLHWFMQHWLPQASQGLTRQPRIAIILTDVNQFGKLGSDLIIRASLAQNSELACRYFVGNDDVYAWLMGSS